MSLSQELHREPKYVLKNIAGSFKLPDTGSKRALVERLVANVSEDDLEEIVNGSAGANADRKSKFKLPWRYTS